MQNQLLQKTTIVEQDLSNNNNILMNPANSLVVKCPHCGGKKELLQLISGNTLGAEQWSDAKQIAPMLPRVSPSAV